MDELYTKLADLAARFGAEKLVLYGSRARGDFHERSDIDLAVYGMPEKQRGGFAIEVDDLPTLLKLDIVHISPNMDTAFRKNIEKDSVVLYAAEN